MKTFSFSQWLQDAGSAGMQNFSLSQSYNRIAWVHSCVNIIATTASSAPLAFFEGEPEPSNRIEDLEHPVNQLFLTPKEPEIPSLRVLLAQTFTYLGISGEIFWVFQRNKGRLDTIELKSGLKPVFAKGATGDLIGWKYTDTAGKTITYTVEQVLPILYFNPGDPYSGLSPLNAARLSIETEYNIAGWNSSFFKSGMKNPLLLQAKGTLTKDQKGEIKKEIQNYYSGIDGGHGAVLLQGHIDVTPLSMSPKDVDFVQGKKLNREEIISIYGVPPALVGIFEYANYSNVKEQRKIFWENTLLPKMEKITDLIQANVLNKEFPGITCKWDTSQILGLRPEANDVADAAEKYLRMGYSPSQVAIILNVPELDQEITPPTVVATDTPKPDKPKPDKPKPKPQEEAVQLTYFNDQKVFDKWSRNYGDLDLKDTEKLIVDTASVIETYLGSMAKLSDRTIPLSEDRWKTIWSDIVNKELHKSGMAGIRAAVVSIDAVAKQGVISDIPNYFTSLPLSVQDVLKEKIDNFLEESTTIVPVLIDQMSIIKNNVKEYAERIATDLVHTLKELLKYATFDQFGVLKISWVARDKQHAMLHGTQCAMNSEVFPLLNTQHPRAKGALLKDIQGCTCTTVPVQFVTA